VFGSQYFYIGDEKGGVQIYQNKKDFPKLTLGDRVEVLGSVSEVGGVKRINVKKSSDIKILSNNTAVEPTEVAVAEVDEEHAGSLVRLEGQIMEIKTNFMYVDDGQEEIEVYFKQGANIDKKLFKEGEEVRVTGILVKASSGMQIWPRSQEDITVLDTKDQTSEAKASPNDQKQPQIKNKYLFVALGGMFGLLLAVCVRWRRELGKQLRHIKERIGKAK
jgi:DNA/RNA endonuclease YhcR with UshA esterase domain